MIANGGGLVLEPREPRASREKLERGRGRCTRPVHLYHSAGRPRRRRRGGVRLYGFGSLPLRLRLRLRLQRSDGARFLAGREELRAQGRRNAHRRSQ